VPARYRDTYASLQHELTALAAVPVPAHPPAHTAAHTATVLSSGLTTANGNVMHPGILEGKALADSILIVHRMKALGATGVTIAVSFPLLVPTFPDSGEYTTFYREIAQVVHREGMTLSVEENPLFENISTLPVSSYYAGLTLASYEAADHQMAQAIIDAMQPTYLTVLSEPDTYTALLHQPGIDLSDPTVGVQFVNAVTGELDKGGTLVGAGSGTWTSPSYDKALLAHTHIDFLDMHVYPIATSDLDNMQAEVAAAHAADKPLVMTECWLYTLTSGDSPIFGVTAAPEEQAVTTYSFWEPLVSRFLAAMVRYTRANGFLMVSPTSVLNLFAYQTWTPALGSGTLAQVHTAYAQAVTAALTANRVSAVGRTFERLAPQP
jgi:hypothetical protein